MAGLMFLVVIVAALAISSLSGDVRGKDGAAALRQVAGHPLALRVSILLLIAAGVGTLCLAVALFTLTRRESEPLALLALCCRIVEAALYSVSIMSFLSLLSLEGDQSPGGRLGVELADLAVNADRWQTNIGATFFAVGSLLYAYLLLRTHAIPGGMAALGLAASAILVIAVPLQTAAGRATVEGASLLVWIPMIAFECSAGAWLLVRGAG